MLSILSLHHILRSVGEGGREREEGREGGRGRRRGRERGREIGREREKEGDRGREGGREGGRGRERGEGKGGRGIQAHTLDINIAPLDSLFQSTGEVRRDEDIWWAINRREGGI